MAAYKVIVVFIAMFIHSNAFFVPPPNVPPIDGADIGEHFLNQKLSYLENKLKNKYEMIKEKIEADKEAEKAEETDAAEGGSLEGSNPILQHKLWFLENKFNGPKYDWIKQKIEAKQQAKQEAIESKLNDKDLFQQKLAFKQNWWDSNHEIAKRSVQTEEEGTKTKNPAIGAYFLNQKLAFLENKFKDTFVDFDTIKAKIQAKKEAEAAAEAATNNPSETASDKFAHLLSFLKELHAEKVNFAPRIAKRSVKPADVETSGAAIGNYFLNQKLNSLENKFKGTMVDFDAIKAKIEAKQAAKQEALLDQEKLEETKQEVQRPAIEKDQALDEKLLRLQNFLRQLTAEQLARIIEKIEGKHTVAKRAIGGPNYGAGIRDHFLKQKFDFLENKFKGKNVEYETLKEKIKSKQQKA